MKIEKIKIDDSIEKDSKDFNNIKKILENIFLNSNNILDSEDFDILVFKNKNTLVMERYK